ncbi:MAG: exopolysaccharide biosynthesis polyprenyl glycosylphosphotransferase [Acidobacteria bacterium]|nr:exopolysaccharide biosynthesis polyprenyl glycosylphosphotransferase [Acidobacteriota bacterium]
MDRSGLERVFLLIDLGVLLVAMLFSHAAREMVSGPLHLKAAAPLSEFVLLAIVFIPTWALAAMQSGLNRLPVLSGDRLVALRALVATQFWGGVALTGIVVVANVTLNRSFLAIFLLVSTAFLFGTVLFQREVALRSRAALVSLVIGSPSKELVSELERYRGHRVEILADVSPEALKARLLRGQLDEVVLAGDAPELRRVFLSISTEAGIPSLVATAESEDGLPLPVPEVFGARLWLSYRPVQPDATALAAKFILEWCLAAILLVFFSPLLALAALLVKITSKGPVFFVQERGGLRGRPFRILKLRTMREGAESEREKLQGRNEMDGPVFKIADDPRITPIGRFLRRTSIDELPQLFNVLLGQMALVGPRPLPLQETEQLQGPHRRRLGVRPGITGLWQVSGRNDLTFAGWMALDLYYVDRWSIGLDLAIMLRTIPAVLSARGAR